MKISELEEFRFAIGNTLEDEDVEVYATNKGIEVDGEIDGEYDDVDIIDAHDLCNAIDDALLNCSTLSEEDKEELGTYLGAEYDVDIWWEENYG